MTTNFLCIALNLKELCQEAKQKEVEKRFAEISCGVIDEYLKQCRVNILKGAFYSHTNVYSKFIKLT